MRHRAGAARRVLEALDEGEGEYTSTRLPPILLIDDDALVLEALKLLFRRQYRVIACASAKEGVTALHDDICAVILDIKMSGQDGFWACNQIRQKYPAIPVIFHTAYQDIKDGYAVINEHRPFGYIMKGTDTSKLCKTVALAVRLQSLIIENRKQIDALRRVRERAAR